jgi:hypothetical protein
MREKMKLPPDITFPEDMSPFDRFREVTKRLLAVPKSEIDRREQEILSKKNSKKPDEQP